jgi:uncharacterized phage protein (predicted DNA packaging)
MILSLDEAKNYLRVDLDDDDTLIQSFITAAENYLQNATGKDYPETDDEGNAIPYDLEKVYLNLLIAYWYENRSAAPRNKSLSGEVPDEFTFATRSLLLQLQL